MDDEPGFLTADQLEAMTPAERSAAFEERIVTNPDDLPASFRDRIFASAERLSQERHPAPEV